MYYYTYDGSVKQFGRIIGHFSGATRASSEEEARKNLTYQAKKARGLIPSSQLTLPDKITRA